MICGGSAGEARSKIEKPWKQDRLINSKIRNVLLKQDLNKRNKLLQAKMLTILITSSEKIKDTSKMTATERKKK